MKENEMVGWHPDSVDVGLSEPRETVKDSWYAATDGVAKSQTRFSN